MNKIKCILPYGKANAIHQKELAKRLGVTPATVKIMVHEARLQGVEICSGTQGYWLAENDAERNAFVKAMYGQGLSHMESARRMKYSLNTIQGQLSLPDALSEASEGDGMDEQT